jgi:transglycosylase-like protein with SLT domain
LVLWLNDCAKMRCDFFQKRISTQMAMCQPRESTESVTEDCRGRLLSFINWSLKRIRHPGKVIAFTILLGSLPVLCAPAPAHAYVSLLRELIVDYNRKQYTKSLSDGTYRGEAGILRIGPEVARSLGLKVIIAPDYLEAKALFARADILLKKAVAAMSTRKREVSPGEHAGKVGELALKYNEALKAAKRNMKAYSLKLKPDMDERLDATLCSGLMEELLQKAMKRASHNLRDALGFFYNRCGDIRDGRSALNTRNIRFVNHVFSEFKGRASEEDINRLDLDMCRGGRPSRLRSGWKTALGGHAFRYLAFIEPLIQEKGEAEDSGDVLLFLALIRQESNFNPSDVSYVGAVGLTQIMPKTAKDLGMRNVYMPPYFDEAQSLMGRERRLRRRAISLISKVTETNREKLAGRARKFMQESISCRRERTRLYSRYRSELLKQGTDDRLDPRKSIEFGLKYFSGLLRRQRGDMSLALASYNAGPHRVRQFGGIPPYAETVSFRNRVLRYYRDYLDRVRPYEIADAVERGMGTAESRRPVKGP